MPVVEIASHIHTTLHRAIAYVIGTAHDRRASLRTHGTHPRLHLAVSKLADLPPPPFGLHMHTP